MSVVVVCSSGVERFADVDGQEEEAVWGADGRSLIETLFQTASLAID